MDGAAADAGPGPYLSISLEQPATGPVASPIAVEARLVRSASTVPSPASLTLTADGAIVGQILYSGSPDIVTDTFVTSWSPGVEGVATLVATVALGSPYETRSAPVVVDVDLNPPNISGIVTTCAVSGCFWNAGFTVRASVSDVHLDPSTVTLTAARAGVRIFGPAQMSASGGGLFSVDLAAKLPFDALTGVLDLSVEARDTLGHWATGTLSTTLTRVLWSRPCQLLPPSTPQGTSSWPPPEARFNASHRLERCSIRGSCRREESRPPQR
jgi:hypothetical protein